MKYKRIFFISLLLILTSFISLYIFAQGVGYIQIKCGPGAMVFLDNNFVGNTSLEQVGLILQDVPAGSYVIKIVKEGFEPQSVKIDLKVNEIYVYKVEEFIPQLDVKQEGEADTDTIKQRVGSLLIETIPIDCIIEIPKLNINKEHYGNKTKKTWEISKVPIGSYRLNFIALGKKIEYNLKIEEGIQKHLLVNILKNEVKEIVPPPIIIGNTGPAGGLIFYDKGSYSDGWRYLEAAPSDLSGWTQWHNRKDVKAVATGKEIGDGYYNTKAIVREQGSGYYAAKLCDNLTLEGYNDWFLPSLYELNLMYKNLYLKGVGGFASSVYWSSSEYSAKSAWYQTFAHGDQSALPKISDGRVRAARAF